MVNFDFRPLLEAPWYKLATLLSWLVLTLAYHVSWKDWEARKMSSLGEIFSFSLFLFKFHNMSAGITQVSVLPVYCLPNRIEAIIICFLPIIILSLLVGVLNALVYFKQDFLWTSFMIFSSSPFVCILDCFVLDKCSETLWSGKLMVSYNLPNFGGSAKKIIFHFWQKKFNEENIP